MAKVRVKRIKLASGATATLTAAKRRFDEAAHPRGKGGKFISKGGPARPKRVALVAKPSPVPNPEPKPVRVRKRPAAATKKPAAKKVKVARKKPAAKPKAKAVRIEKPKPVKDKPVAKRVRVAKPKVAAVSTSKTEAPAAERSTVERIKAWRDADPETVEQHARVLEIGAELESAKAARDTALEKLNAAQAATGKVFKSSSAGLASLLKKPAYRQAKDAEESARREFFAASKAYVDARENTLTSVRAVLAAKEGPAEVRFVAAGAEDITGHPNFKQGVEFFASVAGKGTKIGGGFYGTDPVKVFPATGRASADAYANAVNLDVAHDNPGVVAHEFGHHVEYSNPALLAESRAFRDERNATDAGGERPLKRTDGDGYGDDEKTVDDKWFSNYSGKTTTIGTEIITMGFTHFWEDPVGFAKADPEHFQFVLSALKKNRKAT